MQLRRQAHRRSGIGLAAALCCAGAALALVVAGALAGGPTAQDKPNTKTALCADDACHVDITSRKVMHRPAAQLLCMDCHEYASPEQHLFRLTTPKRDLCDGCHTLELGTMLHTPVAERDCTGCHDPHGSDHRQMLVADPARELCTTCHENDYSDRKFVHGPVAVGACIVCHEPHSAWQDNLLRQSSNKLCIGCHTEASPTGLAARRVHKPMEEGCDLCHDPHASDWRGQVREPARDLCIGCHDSMDELIDTAAVVHGPLAEERGCVSCHNPHYSLLRRLQKWPQPEICLTCHDEAIETADGRTLTNMAALLEDNPSHHGPIREGTCTSCHQPHGGEHNGLLLQEYPPEFYAPFEAKRYALCFSCHMSDLVEDSSGTGLTGFRDADLNLHWLHVNQEKGRTCRACHEVHASQRPFHIRESVPFGSGGWLLELNFQKTDEGGSCLPACHKLRTYSRQEKTGDEP